jgi:hypothetical protein
MRLKLSKCTWSVRARAGKIGESLRIGIGDVFRSGVTHGAFAELTLGNANTKETAARSQRNIWAGISVIEEERTVYLYGGKRSEVTRREVTT